MTTPVSPPPHADRLHGIASQRSNRRRFLVLAVTSTATLLALPGCETPTFDPETTTLTFRRASSGGSGRRN